MPCRSRRISIISFALCAVTLWPIAGVARADDPDLSTIRNHLASNDYRQREQGHTELSKLPLTALYALRALEMKETDEEVATRLHARVHEMEAYILTHPMALSLKKGDYSIAELAAALNKQLGTDALIVSNAHHTFTLSADNQPFWEILRQVYDQQPFNIEAIPADDKKPQPLFRLTPLQADAKPQTFAVADAFAVLSPTVAEPGSGGWWFHADIFCDPRVKIVQYQTSIVVDKITTFDDKNLFFAVGRPSTGLMDPHKPITHFQPTFMVRQDSASPTHLKEVRGSVHIKLVDEERTISFDLAKDVGVRQETLAGSFLLDKAGGNHTLRITLRDGDGIGAFTDAGESVPEFSIRFRDKKGTMLTAINCRLTMIPLEQILQLIAPGVRIEDVASIDFTVIEKTRDCTLPLVFKDIDLSPLQRK